MYNSATTTKTANFVNKFCNDYANIEEKMDECRGKYLEAMDRGDTTCTFYVGTDLALSIALMSEFSEIYRVEHDDDNRTVIVHLDEFPEEETFEE